jgi:hypothetical protein
VIDVPTEASDWDDEPSVSELEGLAFSEKSLAPWLQPNPTFPEQAFIDEVMNLRRPQDVAVKLRDQAFAEFTENDRWQLETSFGKN